MADDAALKVVPTVNAEIGVTITLNALTLVFAAKELSLPALNNVVLANSSRAYRAGKAVCWTKEYRFILDACDQARHTKHIAATSCSVCVLIAGPNAFLGFSPVKITYRFVTF